MKCLCGSDVVWSQDEGAYMCHAHGRTTWSRRLGIYLPEPDYKDWAKVKIYAPTDDSPAEEIGELFGEHVCIGYMQYVQVR